MTTRFRFALTVACAALLALGAAVLPAPAGAGTPQELAAQRQAVTDLRNVGTAMYIWYKKEVEPRINPDAPAGGEPMEKGTVDLATVPVISAAELGKLLVPQYIAAIPELDPWGRPYEYRLNTREPRARGVMAVRTAGRDGQSAGTAYQIGGFPLDDFDQDVVWIDGFFARWPQR